MVKVLLVDDDEIFREATRVMLCASGFAVTEASDGHGAVELFRQSPDSIVLCDIFMTGKEGFETIRDLRAEFPGARIIAMSVGDSRARMDVFKIAMRMGAAATIRKPFDQQGLLTVIGRLTASPSET
jgi:CheY-like chemotaxis protein